MFFKCLDCGTVALEPELNMWQCPICQSENLTFVETEAASAPIVPRGKKAERHIGSGQLRPGSQVASKPHAITTAF